jgi:hypothetical protein
MVEVITRACSTEIAPSAKAVAVAGNSAGNCLFEHASRSAHELRAEHALTPMKAGDNFRANPTTNSVFLESNKKHHLGLR